MAKPEVDHARSGRVVTTPLGQVFVRDEGAGPVVLCVHGAPTSSFLYRHVIQLVARGGARAVAPDLLGMGLSERPDPDDADLSVAGLAAGLGATAEALELGDVILVLHDIGGPVGLRFAVDHPDRVAGILALNTFTDTDTYRPPWPMSLFSRAGPGEVALASMTAPAALAIWRRVGVAHASSTSLAEVRAHLRLLRRQDRGRAFLRIMRSFPTDEPFRLDLEGRLSHLGVPARVVWGGRDTMLGLERAGLVAEALGGPTPQVIDAKHFVPEDAPGEVAEAALRLVGVTR